MSAIEFGKVLPCNEFGGSGNGPLNKTERARELRMAKRRGELPPLIAYPPCGYCGGTGLVDKKGKYK